MKLDEQQKAVALRKRGYSMREISERLHVSKSSVSLWVRSVPLSPQALKRLDGIYTAGQIASQETHRKITAKKTADASLLQTRIRCLCPPFSTYLESRFRLMNQNLESAFIFMGITTKKRS